MPKGIFCLEKNFTEIAESIEKDQKKGFWTGTSYRGKIFIITNTLLFDIVLTYFFMASLREAFIKKK